MKLRKIVTFVSILGILSCNFPKVSYAANINIIIRILVILIPRFSIK